MVDVSDLLGKKYSDHGRGPDTFDCYGLVIEVQRRYGNELKDFDYQAVTDAFIGDSILNLENDEHITKIDGYVDGAILLFSNMSGFKNHIGVYIGDGNVIHCNFRGVHIERLEMVEKFVSGVYVWQK